MSAGGDQQSQRSALVTHGNALLVSHLEMLICFLHYTIKLDYDRLSQSVVTKQPDSCGKYWSSPFSLPLFLCQHKSTDFCKVIHTQIHLVIILSIKLYSPGLKADEDADFSCPNFSRKGAQHAPDHPSYKAFYHPGFTSRSLVWHQTTLPQNNWEI